MMHKSEKEINHLNFENVGHLPWIDYVIAVFLRKDLVLWLTYGHKEACRDYSKKIHDTKTSLASITSSLKSWIYVKCYYIPLPRKVYVDIYMFFYIWMSYTFMQIPYKWIYIKVMYTFMSPRIYTHRYNKQNIVLLKWEGFCAWTIRF